MAYRLVRTRGAHTERPTDACFSSRARGGSGSGRVRWGEKVIMAVPQCAVFASLASAGSALRIVE